MESIPDEMKIRFSVEIVYPGSIQATNNFEMYEYFHKECTKKWPEADVLGRIKHDIQKEKSMEMIVTRQDGDVQEFTEKIQEDGKIRHSNLI